MYFCLKLRKFDMKHIQFWSTTIYLPSNKNWEEYLQVDSERHGGASSNVDVHGRQRSPSLDLLLALWTSKIDGVHSSLQEPCAKKNYKRINNNVSYLRSFFVGINDTNNNKLNCTKSPRVTNCNDPSILLTVSPDDRYRGD